MITPPTAATAPPLRPVPAPRGITGTPWRCATLTAAATCAVDSGKTHRLRLAALDRPIELKRDELFRRRDDALATNGTLELAHHRRCYDATSCRLIHGAALLYAFGRPVRLYCAAFERGGYSSSPPDGT